MYLFKKKYSICLVSLWLMGFLSQAQTNEQANSVYIQWQTSNCGINEENALIDLLLENREVMEPELLRGFREGPPEGYLESATASEMNRLRLNQKNISEKGFETGLSKEDLDIAAKANLDSAKENIERQITDGWKTRALTGLNYIKTNESIKLLEALAKDQSNPFNALAKFLIVQNENE